MPTSHVEPGKCRRPDLAFAANASTTLTDTCGKRVLRTRDLAPVVSDNMIAVQKGKDRWEIARDANTKMTGDVKVGTKVTIMYTMTATEVEVKAEKAAKKP